MAIADTIRKIPLFHGIEKQIIDELAQHCRSKHLNKGAELFAMGDPADRFFVIRQGWIKLYRISREGEETIIHIFGPGESFAEAAVFSEQKRYPVNAQAIDKTEMIEVPRSFFVHKIEEDSRFALRMLGAIASRQHYLVQQLEQVTTRTAPQRIGAFLLRLSKTQSYKNQLALTVELPYDKSIISTRLNIKPETFSRALSKLEPYGVHAENRKVIIKDPQKLAEYCDVPARDQPC